MGQEMPMLGVMKTIWRAWRGFGRRLISAQNHALMALAWVIAVLPVALVLKLMGRRLVPQTPIDPEATTYWESRDQGPLTMERARRMF